MPAGRPSLYTAEMDAEICGRIAGGESLTKICRDDHMPTPTTVYLWIATNAEFSHRYMCAREDQADTLADEIKDISDDVILGARTKVSTNENGEVTEEVVTLDMVERAKLRVEARKWIAAKLKPKKYSERLQMEASGPNGGAIQHTLNISADEAYKRMLEGKE